MLSTLQQNAAPNKDEHKIEEFKTTSSDGCPIKMKVVVKCAP